MRYSLRKRWSRFEWTPAKWSIILSMAKRLANEKNEVKFSDMWVEIKKKHRVIFAGLRMRQLYMKYRNERFLLKHAGLRTGDPPRTDEELSKFMPKLINPRGEMEKDVVRSGF